VSFPGPTPAGPPGDAAPTAQWLAAAAGLPPLEGAADVAERLLLLLHYGINWQDGWVTRHRGAYWAGVLPDRVIAAAYLEQANLRRWWRAAAQELGSQPRTAAERAELEQLLRADPAPVLEVLRAETEPLLLRTRIVADAVRTARRPAQPPETG
jgi:hypothetical protein